MSGAGVCSLFYGKCPSGPAPHAPISQTGKTESPGGGGELEPSLLHSGPERCLSLTASEDHESPRPSVFSSVKRGQ